MHPKRNTRRPMVWGMVLTAGLAGAIAYGQEPKTPPLSTPTVTVDAKTGALLVPLGGLVTFDPKLGKDIPTDVVVSQEDIVGVRVDPTNPGKFLLSGKQTGVSQLTLVFKDKPRMLFDVVVQPDLNLLRNIIKRTVPTAAVDVQPGMGNVIIVSGYVTSPQDADTVNRLAINAAGNNINNVINAVQVGGGQQVQIDVVIASVDRSMLRQRGFDFAAPGSTVTFQSIVSGLIGVQGGQGGGGGGGGGAGAAGMIPQLSSAANIQFGIVPAPFFGALQALRVEGIAKFIGEPRVVTQSGRLAFFRSGGQQAILSGTSGITGPGVQLVPFGTELEVLPIVYGNGQIWLEINPRVSAVSQALGISVGGANSPGFTEQQVRTAIMLESGQTFAIGGLIQNSVQASANKVPILGDLPFVGVGFSRVSHEQRESELVILVTPRLVAPLNCDQVPKRLPGRETRNPDDYELFLENVLEAPRGQRKVWNGRCYNAPWKCDPTAAIYPCVGPLCTGVNGAAACGPNGTCGPLGGVAPAVPVHGGAAIPVPATLPPIPGGASRVPSGEGDAGAVSLPAAAPPVVVVPEIPRN